MKTALLPTLRLAAATLLLAGGTGAAQAHVSVDLNIGVPIIGVHGGWGAYRGGYGGGHGGYHHRYRGGWGGYWGPAIVVAPPIYSYGYYGPPVIVQAPPEVVEAAPAPAAPTRPDPVIYPRNAQSAEQTELDRRECNRWATTQPAAVADASVFQRAVEACMDGRGYSMR